MGLVRWGTLGRSWRVGEIRARGVAELDGLVHGDRTQSQSLLVVLLRSSMLSSIGAVASCYKEPDGTLNENQAIAIKR